MTDNTVSERFTFTFAHYGTKIQQKLTLSRDLEKLMEVYDDSKCRIWKKNFKLENQKKVYWSVLFQIKKYPTPLQGFTCANFLFSPNLNFFIDVAVISSQFIIRSAATNEIMLYIPRGLYGFKNANNPR